MEQEAEINLRSPTTLQDLIRAVDRAGGLPVVVLPVLDGKVIAQGIGCLTGRDIIEAIRAAYRHSADCVRIVAASIDPAS